MPTLLLKSGRIFDPATKLDFIGDVLVDQATGTIKDIGKNLSGDSALDCTGKLVCPGFVDIHVHFREPGNIAKETIATGSAAAVHGGFCTVVVMPNTDPPLDNPAAIAYQYLQAKNANKARVFPMGCITKGRAGQELAELGLMARGSGASGAASASNSGTLASVSSSENFGAVAFTDDGAAVPGSQIMRSAFEYANALDRVIVEHCEDHDLSNGAIMHEGKVSAALGINGYPSAAEELIVARDIRLAKLANSRFHVSHISAKGAVALVRDAKARGERVTAEVSPHHLLLTDEGCRNFDTAYKMNPPLREQSDLDACLKGLLDGTIDCFASDHAPHTSEEKAREFVDAPNGIIGLESNIGVLLTKLVAAQKLPLARFVEAWTSAPARCLSLEKFGVAGKLEKNGPADITILDLEKEWSLDASKFKSKARNCPFNGWKLQGAPVWTIVGGVVHEAIGIR
ncbi:MAG TPA: dihydroorotase [Planctomycetota bacterium]|nr:dihydroorotase [Planctomycetota bacterium]